MYRQCKLQRGCVNCTCWVPSQFAVKGKVLKIKNEGKWEDGWTVEEAYKGEISDETARAIGSQHRTHRKHTDI